jgi:hypothetical protein
MAIPWFSDDVAGTVLEIKHGPATLDSLKLVNTTDATAYLQVFNLVQSAVVLGTTAPVMTIRLGANESIFIPIHANLTSLSGSGSNVVNFGFSSFTTTQPLTTGTASPTGLSVAGTTTATGSTGAGISVLALYS